MLHPKSMTIWPDDGVVSLDFRNAEHLATWFGHCVPAGQVCQRIRWRPGTLSVAIVLADLEGLTTFADGVGILGKTSKSLYDKNRADPTVFC